MPKNAGTANDLFRMERQARQKLEIVFKEHLQSSVAASNRTGPLSISIIKFLNVETETRTLNIDDEEIDIL